jgi:subtilisin family serine protease
MGIVLCAGIAAAAPTIHPLLKPLIETAPSTQAIPLVLSLSGGSGSGASGVAERFGVWVRTRDGGKALESLGLLPPSGLATLRPARWTRDQLRAAAVEASVISIGPAVRCVATLDSSLVDIGARRVHGPHGIPPAYDGPTGTGIIVGIVDTGIDLQHGDFHLPNGHTRIVALWDQTTPSTDPPRGFHYGKEWTMDQINAGLSDENDVIGHGTHVAGTAAGNGSATGNGQAAYRYVGMAPDAQIVFVKTDFASTSIVDGVNYVFQKADSLHLPAVVNLSLGTQYGPHDGTDDMSLAIAQLTGTGKVVVAAAGNDQGKAVHAHRVVSARSDTAQVTLSVSPYTAQTGAQNDEIDLDGWYSPIVPLTVTILTPGGTPVGPVPMGSATGTNTPDGHVLIDNSQAGVNGDREVVIQLLDQAANQPPASGIWRIELSGGTIPPADSTSFEVWNFYQSMSSHVGFIYGVEEKDIVLAPASGDSVIASGAYVSRVSWVAENGTRYNYSPVLPHGELAPFSSIGYRRDGVIKPEIAAPGRGVAASLSSSATGIDPHLVVEDGVHVVFEGTSMASPHVAGCVALMFQKLGPRGVQETRTQLTSTARVDAFTGTVPNAAWGYGKLDAVRAVGFNEPVSLVEAEAHQDGDRMLVRFLLSEDAGTAPFPVWREDAGQPGRTMLGWSSEGHERTFVDSTLVAGGDYVYWLDVSNGGEGEWIGPASGHFIPVRRLSLATSPNPFLAKTSIRWTTPASAGVITIHDVTGRRIRRFDCGPRSAGTIVWDGADAAGHPVAAGLYFAKLSSGASSVERRILRLR